MRLKPKQHYEIGEEVQVPHISGTLAALVSIGRIEKILKTQGGGFIAFVRLQYGNRIKTLPFKFSDLNRRGWR